MRPTVHVRMLIAIAAAMLVAAPAVDAAVKITRKPSSLERKTFDPAKPPKEMPPLHNDEQAVCTQDYGCAVQLVMRPTSRKLPNGKTRVTLVVDDVKAELTAKIVIWTPTGVSDKVKAHEEGHRQIAEKIYGEVADRAVKAAADKLDGRRFEAEADTAKDAESAANEKLSTAHTAMIRAYLDQTSVAGQKVQVYYDEITGNGAKAQPAEAEAIKLAWEKFPPPLWIAPKPPATKPATKPAKK